MYGVELGRSYNLCELFHVDGFDVDNVWSSARAVIALGPVQLTKTLVAYVQIPKIDT